MKTRFVSENIRLIREFKGYSQEFVASKLHITQQAYSKMEKDPESMSLRRLTELSQILGVEITDIIVINTDIKDAKSTDFMEKSQNNDFYKSIINDIKGLKELKDQVYFLKQQLSA